MQMISGYYAEQLVFLDETRRDGDAIRRRYGRALPGITPMAVNVPGMGKAASILALCGMTGFLAWDVIEGGYNADAFLAVFEHKLCPLLQPFPDAGSVLVLDNCSIHHAVAARMEVLVAARGAKIVWLPAYSPDFTPIEAMFSELKAWFRRYFRWVASNLENGRAVELAMRSCVNVTKAVAHYEHAGYRASPEFMRMVLVPLMKQELAAARL